MSDHSQLRELFVAACDLPVAEQDAFVDEHCSDHPKLRTALKRLLASDGETDGFFSDGNTTAGIAFQFDTVVDGESTVQDSGRYELLGEIARGGMGAILEGRDIELGRELAIKVLLDEHKDNPQIVQRFLEEAQIAGQLQHPGIAPIYEVGRLPDKRPFISMKLIKGETLATLLKKRNNPADDRGKFLGIFEQICQTLAYAHSRSVIHRDLKPDNLMVGAFGEVQVMDWGLAKILSTESGSVEKSPDQSLGAAPIQTIRSPGNDQTGTGSTTRVGSVMGTPAFMPPEQALGNIDQLDQRSDVFALGAILCEILTGKPIYSKPNVSPAGILQMAASAELNECFHRLDRLDADHELVALTKECLAKEQNKRPDDASVLVKRINQYLESVETRLRETEIERAAQSARADEENKRRRVTMVLAATILLATLLGGLGWTVFQKQKSDTRSAAIIRIDESINNALLHKSLAKTAESKAEPDLEMQVLELNQALASAKDAAKEAEMSGVDSSLRTSANKLLVELENEALRAKQLSAQAALDQSVKDDLELIRLTNGRGVRALSLQRRQQIANEVALKPERSIVDLSETPPLYQQAFRKAGIDIAANRAAQSAAMISDSAIQESLIAALDNWARALSLEPGRKETAQEETSPENAIERRRLLREKLFLVADKTDSSEWRKGLRAALSANDIDKMKGIASTDESQQQSNELICWLGARLRNEKQFAASVGLLRQAQQRDPGDFWLNYELGVSLAASEGQEFEALGYLRAALGIRPRSTAMLTELSQHLRRLNRFTDAETYDRFAIEIDPDFAMAHGNLAVSLQAQGKLDEAIKCLRKSIDLDSTLPMAHYNLGTMLSDQNKLDEAITELSKAVELDPEDGPAHFNLGLTLHRQGKIDAAIARYRRTLELDPSYINARLNLSGCWSQKGDLDQMIVELQEAIKYEPGFADLYVNLANALSDRGATDDAIANYRKAIELDPNHPKAHYNFGYCLSTVGRDDEAIEEYRKAIELVPGYVKAINSIGLVFLKQKRFAEAVVEFRNVVIVSPDVPWAHSHLGEALYRHGEWEEALESLENSMQLSKESSGMRIKCSLYAAMAHWKLGNQDEAKAMHQVALEWRKDNPQISSPKQTALFDEVAGVVSEKKNNNE